MIRLKVTKKRVIALARGFILASGLVFFSSWASAMVMQNLAQGVVPMPPGAAMEGSLVNNTHSPVLQRSFRQALDQVLVKLTGNPAVTTLPAVRNQFQSVMPWVRSYDTQTLSQAGTDRVYLRVQFDKKSIVAQLRAAGQPVWADDRPQTLIYVVTIKDNKAQLITALDGAEDSAGYARQINTTAALRGVSVILPRADPATNDVAMGLAKQGEPELSDQQLQALRSTYGVDSVLVGVFKPESLDRIGVSPQALKAGANNPVWESQWRLYVNKQDFSWNQDAMSMAQAGGQAIASISNMLANQAAVLGSTGRSVAILVSVRGVDDIAQYQRIVADLLRLSSVSGVQLQQAMAGRIILKVNVAGGASYLKQVMQKPDLKPASLALQGNAIPGSAGAVSSTGSSSSARCSFDLCLHWLGGH